VGVGKVLFLTKKKFGKKWPADEWLEKDKNGKWRLKRIGNWKKWMTKKYYGFE
jgi:hypothetical protein